MRAEYRRWIDKYVDDAPGLCREVCFCMEQTFTYLIAVYGRYTFYDPDLGREVTEDHAWCVDRETNELVDPTIAQFEPGGTYEEDELLVDATQTYIGLAIESVSNADTLQYGGLEVCNTYLALKAMERIDAGYPFTVTKESPKGS